MGETRGLVSAEASEAALADTHFGGGRAKPIDLLARYISADGDDIGIEMHEPYTFLNVQSLALFVAPKLKEKFTHVYCFRA